jgi:hypothetical protein
MRLLTATLAAMAFAAPAAEARNVPVGFYGVSYDGELRSESAAFQAGAWRRMAANRVETARTVFSWERAQGQEGQEFDFHQSDLFVRQAAENGIDLLPIVQDTPLWARSRVRNWWPERSADYAAYVAALVGRYGPDGSYWPEHPEVPMRPIRHWQIFNEPGLSGHYGPLLDAAHDAVKEADPGAKVVLAGLTGTEEGSPWDILDYQYRRGGIAGSFDIAAMHLYTGKAENVVEGLRLFRRVMKRHGDGGKPVWLTEFGITASKGRTKAPRSQRTLRTTDRGMARFLHEAYRRLARRDRKLHLERAYWYTWASSYERGAGIFRFAGLYRYSNGSYFPKDALAKYRASARRDQAG